MTMKIIFKTISEIKPYEKNPRKYEAAVPKVMESIKRFGFKNPLVIDVDNVIVCGHARLKAAKKLGLKEVPCIVADDLTPEKIKAFRLADNKTAEFSEWDTELLSAELADLLALDIDFDMADLGFDIEIDTGEEADESQTGTTAEDEEERQKKIQAWLAEKNCRLLHGDCAEKLKELPSCSIDLVVTSPPYDDLREYNEVGASWNFDKFTSIAKELHRVLKEGGVIVWIVNDATVNGSETGTSFRHALHFKDVLGMNLHDTMIWHKSTPYPGNIRYWPSFEYMFVLSKGAPKYTNIIKDRQNKYAGRPKKPTYRMADGSLVPPRKNAPKNILENSERENVWDIAACVSNIERTGHPAQYPEQLAHDHIISWCDIGDTVLDCFMGSGTTGVAALGAGRNFVGIEMDDSYYSIAENRLTEALEQADGRKFEGCENN